MMNVAAGRGMKNKVEHCEVSRSPVSFSERFSDVNS